MTFNPKEYFFFAGGRPLPEEPEPRRGGSPRPTPHNTKTKKPTPPRHPTPNNEITPHQKKKKTPPPPRPPPPPPPPHHHHHTPRMLRPPLSISLRRDFFFQYVLASSFAISIFPSARLLSLFWKLLELSPFANSVDPQLRGIVLAILASDPRPQVGSIPNVPPRLSPP